MSAILCFYDKKTNNLNINTRFLLQIYNSKIGGSGSKFSLSKWHDDYLRYLVFRGFNVGFHFFSSFHQGHGPCTFLCSTLVLRHFALLPSTRLVPDFRWSLSYPLEGRPLKRSTTWAFLPGPHWINLYSMNSLACLSLEKRFSRWIALSALWTTGHRGRNSWFQILHCIILNSSSLSLMPYFIHDEYTLNPGLPSFIFFLFIYLFFIHT